MFGVSAKVREISLWEQGYGKFHYETKGWQKFAMKANIWKASL
jgi:hypothetical protein